MDEGDDGMAVGSSLRAAKIIKELYTIWLVTDVSSMAISFVRVKRKMGSTEYNELTLESRQYFIL